MIELAGEVRRAELYELAIAVNLAFAEPKRIPRLLDRPGREIKAEGMIAIPKKSRG